MEKAIAVLYANNTNSICGNICFQQNAKGGPTIITGNIKGLTPGLHGFHVHQFGDIRKSCISAGPHFNPFGKTHGGPTDIEKHVGDLGNIMVDSDGTAHVDISSNHIQLMGPHSIIGRSIVVHANPDDFGRGVGDKREESLKTGNAGSRIACGVIGIASLA
uniref:Superoxide dismutase [Cu-Zn] n=1 Tax=Setaria digitata TaxID=48799 RepID=A0A915Q119_9BILA